MSDLVAEAFQTAERERLAPLRLSMETNGLQYGVMPFQSADFCATKIVSMQPENPKAGLATIQGIMVVNDAHTGAVRCVMDGKALTALRTGAIGAAAVKALTPEDVSAFTVIGTGVQARQLVIETAKVRSIRTLRLYDVAPARAERFLSDVGPLLPGSISVRCSPSAAEAIRDADVVITATSSPTPVFPEEAALLRGKWFIGIGAAKPDAREYPTAFYSLLERIYIDSTTALEEAGDIRAAVRSGAVGERDLITLGAVLLRGNAVRERAGFFKSVGHAAADAYVAEAICRQAEGKQLGTELFL